MADAEWSVLRDVLVRRYDDLLRQLVRRFRSPELAQDALQNAYLRIEQGGEIGAVAHPQAYIFRMASNLALAQKRSERRLLTAADIDAALDIADDAPNPAQAAETKSELEALDRALVDLPARQRAIFLALWKGHQSPVEIAKRFGLSSRKVYLELKAAREHCVDVLAKAAKRNDFQKK
jgi:RNA polymerase sigma-70 factor (ECF subfamily)